MKKVMLVSIAVLMTMMLSGCPDPVSDPVAYAIGDIGPSGVGIVFFVLDGGFHGLEVAPVDQSTGIVWALPANQVASVPGTRSTLGTGLANTELIIDQNGPGTTYAAGVARAYTGGGLTDWYLPSVDDLQTIWEDLVDDGTGANSGIGGFASDFYWSSTEGALVDIAWGQEFFASFSQDTADKADSYYVRAVRTF